LVDFSLLDNRVAERPPQGGLLVVRDRSQLPFGAATGPAREAHGRQRKKSWLTQP